MARGGRVLYCGIAAGALAVLLSALRPEAPQEPFAAEGGRLEAVPQPNGSRTALASAGATAEIARFVALLDRLRGWVRGSSRAAEEREVERLVDRVVAFDMEEPSPA